jgi:hypothetical protein
MGTAKWVLAAFVSLVPPTHVWAMEGDGLLPHTDSLRWARWQGRLSLSVQAQPWQAGLGGSDHSGLQLGSISLMGDYYFARSLRVPGSEGGFRATSGLILNGRSQAWGGRAPLGAQAGAFNVERRLATQTVGADAAGDATTLPYLGVGYTGLSIKGGWSFNADLGLVALAASHAVKFGRVFSNVQNFDDVVRDMRVAPVLQVGVSYSF